MRQRKKKGKNESAARSNSPDGVLNLRLVPHRVDELGLHGALGGQDPPVYRSADLPRVKRHGRGDVVNDLLKDLPKQVVRRCSRGAKEKKRKTAVRSRGGEEMQFFWFGSPCL